MVEVGVVLLAIGLEEENNRKIQKMKRQFWVHDYNGVRLANYIHFINF